MAETLALVPAQDPEAPLDAATIRSRFEQLSTLRRGDEEVLAAAVRVSRCEYEVDLKAADAWDLSADARLDAYMKWLRKKVSLAEEENRKLSAEIGVIGETVFKDILIEKLKSSREIISVPSLGWLIRQCQRHIVINAVRRSLVNDANNSRHSFEYLDKDETIVAHLVGGIDAFNKISADWPLSPMEHANGLELQTRRHLVRFVDAVEEILVREMQSELHSSSSSG